MPDEMVSASFVKRCRNADVALVEGAMGLFDSLTEDGKGVLRGLHGPSRRLSSSSLM
jgi:cobyrinic acid a,c-diamide synthase